MGANLKRVAVMILGVIVIAVGISGLVYSRAGTDPFTCMILGFSGTLGVPLTIIQPIINGLLLVVVLFAARDLIGLGTLVNMLAIGAIIDLCNPLFLRFLPADPSLLLRIVVAVVSIVVVSLGVSFYMTPTLGLAPYDIMSFIILRRSKIPFKWCRVATDLLCTVVGFLLGSDVGVGTVVTALFMGPLVVFFNRHVSIKLLGLPAEGVEV